MSGKQIIRALLSASTKSASFYPVRHHLNGNKKYGKFLPVFLIAILIPFLNITINTGAAFAGTRAVNPAKSALYPKTGAFVKNIVQQSFPTSPKSCPWTSKYELAHLTPEQLAKQVVSKMNLLDMLSLVDLYHPKHSYENSTIAIPSLCIPAFTLQDGPNGLSAGDKGVTQLPASLGLGATFSTNFAYEYGKIVGQEAKKQQVDAVQGPNLNLVRVPGWGRAYETYGEDPALAAALGTANVDGIQSTHVMSVAKHFTAYTQETARISLDQQVSKRALEEIYLKPFKAVVQQANVAAIMCAYGYINNINACSDKYTFNILRQFGFTGIIRSDLTAVKQPIDAFNAGLDQIKPSAGLELIIGWLDRRLKRENLKVAAETILTQMFAYHFIPGPDPHKFGADTITPVATNFAYRLAARSVVLLQNKNNFLPLNAAKITSLYRGQQRKNTGRTIAVIGSDASGQAMTAGYGGARVSSPFVVTPLASLKRYFQRFHLKTLYTSGGPNSGQLPVINADLLGGKHLPQAYWPKHVKSKIGFPSDPYLRSSSVSKYAQTASAPGPAGKNSNWDSWSAILTPDKTGVYDFSVSSIGDTWIYINGEKVFGQNGLGISFNGYFARYLVKNSPYRLEMRWFSTRSRPAPRLGMTDITPALNNAAATAKKAKVAIVFVNCFSSEGMDRDTLSLPDGENYLIDAVAKANPRTIVVLNTGGAVLMPWLHHVQAVLEAWYPGEEDGNAIRAVLSGQTDPSGRLPITFPASDSQPFANNIRAWPGVNDKVSFSVNDDNGLEIGYRYYEAHHLQPLFPFGYGLSYTTFSMSHLLTGSYMSGYTNLNTANIAPSYKGGSAAYGVGLELANTGKVYGCSVVQAYLKFPASAGEPFKQLAGFSRVCLAAKQHKLVSISLPLDNFEIYQNNHFMIPKGRYGLYLGFSSETTPLIGGITIK